MIQIRKYFYYYQNLVLIIIIMGLINLKKFIQMKYSLNYFMRNLFLVFEVWAAYIKFCQFIKIHLYYFYLNLSERIMIWHFLRKFSSICFDIF